MIRVLHDYRGVKTNYRLIVAGEYPEGDPALMGLQEYLIENGHAVQFWHAAPDTTSDVIDPSPPEPTITDELDLLNDNQLRQLALDEGVILPHHDLSREELLDTLREWGYPAEVEPDALSEDRSTWSVSALRQAVKERNLTPLDDEGHVVSISKATKAQLIAVLSEADAAEQDAD